MYFVPGSGRFNFSVGWFNFFTPLLITLQTKYLIWDFTLSGESGNIYLADVIYFFFN